MDPTFQAGLSLGTNIECLELQEDGKILMGGKIYLPGRTEPASLVRLHSNGSIDLDFNIPDMDMVERIAVQKDGKILTGLKSSQPIYRLHPDGTFDDSFQFSDRIGSQVFIMEITLLAAQDDGKVLAGADKFSVDGGPVQWLVRLNSDGSLDDSFSLDTIPVDNFFPSLYSMAIQPDGRILVRAQIYQDDGWTYRHLLRINSDGSEDTDFNPAPWLSELVNQDEKEIKITCVAFSPEGNILVSLRENETQCRLVSMDLSGELNAQFEPTLLPIDVVHPVFFESDKTHSIVTQPDGKILVAGSTLGRALPNGGVDETFLGLAEDIQGSISDFEFVRMTSEGKLLVAAKIQTETGEPRNGLAQLIIGELPSEPISISVQPGDQAVAKGGAAVFEVQASGNPPPVYQWRFNGEILPGETSRTLKLDRVESRDAGVYSVTISNGQEEIHSREAILNVVEPDLKPGIVDDRFRPDAVEDAVDVDIHDIALLPEGGLLVARHLKLSDEPERTEVVKLSETGALDPEYRAVFNGEYVEPQLNLIMTIQADQHGRALIGGFFNEVNGIQKPGIVRLDPRGNIDSDFAAQLAGSDIDLSVRTIYLDSNDRILIGGNFESVNGVEMENLNIARLLASGELDPSFRSQSVSTIFPPIISPTVHAILPSNENYILSANWGAVPIDADGTWLPKLGLRTIWSSKAVVSIDSQNGFIVTSYRTGKTTSDGISRVSMWRSHSDLSLDENWQVDFQKDGVITDLVNCHAIQTDGKILVGGGFDALEGTRREGLARLFADGTLDPSFDPGDGIAASPGGEVRKIVPTDKGTIYIAGEFHQFNGYSRQGIARLFGDPIVLQEQPRHESSAFSVQTRTELGERYIWEFTESLQNAQWRTLEEVEGDGRIQNLQDAKTDGASRFYRLRKMERE